MSIVIGAKPEGSFRDPMGLLTDCHRREVSFLSALVAVGAQAQDGSLTAENGAAVDAALRYFSEVVPKHNVDEEESLLPHLRTIADSELRPALDRVVALHGDHIQAEKCQAELDRLGRTWLEAGTLPIADAVRFSALTAKLARLYRDHIAFGRGRICSRLLPPRWANSSAILLGDDMAARRGLR